MTSVVKPWRSAHDMPHTQEQALAVLETWARGALTFSTERCRRVLHCLMKDPPDLIIEVAMHSEGWAYVNAHGHHGWFNTYIDAHDAAVESILQAQRSPRRKCSRPSCNGDMLPGVAMGQTYDGLPDFPGHEVVTMSPGGPGRLVDCLKCDRCGHSVTA